MFWRKKTRVDKEETGFLYSSWESLPFSKYLQLMDTDDIFERMSIASGASVELLKSDKELAKKVEARTLFLGTPYQAKPERGLSFQGRTYVFSEDLDLIEQTNEQYGYVNSHLKFMQKYAKELQEVNEKAESTKKSALKEKLTLDAAEITEKMSKEIIKAYPFFIAAYINTVDGTEYSDKLVNGIAKELLECSCIDILNVGSFFLLNLIPLQRFRNGSLKESEYKKLVTKINKKGLGSKLITKPYHLYLELSTKLGK
jgi:hypothetical protein